jgi:hypothetical protein
MIPTTILYFGDFDPSGEDMVRSLEERLQFFQVYPTRLWPFRTGRFADQAIASRHRSEIR